MSLMFIMVDNILREVLYIVVFSLTVVQIRIIIVMTKCVSMQKSIHAEADFLQSSVNNIVIMTLALIAML